MFGQSFQLFQLFGFPIRLDWSWFILALLITWTLAVGFFPFQSPNLSTATYWWMGFLGAMGLFASIVLHEFAHAWVARRHGLTMSGITLFVFGGVAQMEEEPATPRAELWMAAAGPMTSLLLAGVFWGLSQLGGMAGWPSSVTLVAWYLAIINFILALFNLVPAFPLDGGRILRAILWQWRKNLSWATRITSNMGSGFGLLLMGWGILEVLSGLLLAGGWKILIGLFLRNAARGAYQQLMIREELGNEPVEHFMRVNPICIPRQLTLRQAVKEYFERYPFKLYPVVDRGQMVGQLSLEDLRRHSRSEWGTLTVNEVMTPVSQEVLVQAESEANEALKKMTRQGKSRLFVVGEEQRLVGVLSLSDLLRYITAQLELKKGAPAT